MVDKRVQESQWQLFNPPEGSAPPVLLKHFAKLYKFNMHSGYRKTCLCDALLPKTHTRTTSSPKRSQTTHKLTRITCHRTRREQVPPSQTGPRSDSPFHDQPPVQGIGSGTVKAPTLARVPFDNHGS